ncbi:uncharacterized protein N7458_004350 [Penicillium daleae]|uniref:Uncharacterized protein n=1 Tax=Penicillium daleae TaxID=63821 RepID=A0AAD6CAU0_9EURO|nr:uncharacterized protein N7458_004350 [Penicillium daleae]KAJ5456086.1 hypothetical protein N7458_004350 [Penicillium daleae]
MIVRLRSHSAVDDPPRSSSIEGSDGALFVPQSDDDKESSFAASISGKEAPNISNLILPTTETSFRALNAPVSGFPFRQAPFLRGPGTDGPFPSNDSKGDIRKQFRAGGDERKGKRLIRRKFLSSFFTGGDGRGGSSKEEEVISANRRKDKDTASPSRPISKGKEKALVREESSEDKLGSPALFDPNTKQKRHTNEALDSLDQFSDPILKFFSTPIKKKILAAKRVRYID